MNLITFKMHKYLINKESIKSEKCYHLIRVDAHIYFFKTRIVRDLALKRSAKLLLRSLLCIRFMKEEELSASHASNRKDAQYFQKLSGAWGKGSIMHTANLASAC